MEPILQIALDLVNLDDAIKLAKEAVDTGYVNWIGVGTPLIKNEGLRAVKRVKGSFPGKKIVVDMDVIGHHSELEAAMDAGADVLSISGTASEDVIRNCVSECRKRGIEVMVDITRVPSALESSRRLEDMDVDYLLVNFDDLGEISSSVISLIAVKIDSDTKNAIKAVDLGADVVILGKVINKATDVQRVVRDVKKAISRGEAIPEAISKVPLDENYIWDITRSLENVKNILTKLEAQRRADEENRVHMEEEMKKMEERFTRMLSIERERLEGERVTLKKQREKIKEGWRRLKEAEVKWEEKQKAVDIKPRGRPEDLLKEPEEERKRIIPKPGNGDNRGMEKVDECMLKVEDELKEVETEWRDIEGVWGKIDQDKKEIQEKRRDIDDEWKEIEKIKKDIEGDQENIKKQLEEIEKIKKSSIPHLPQLVSRVSEIKKKQEEELGKIHMERASVQHLPQLVSRISEIKKKQEEELGKIYAEKETIEEKRRDVEKAEKNMESEREKINEDFKKLEGEWKKIKEFEKKGEEKIKKKLGKVGLDLHRLKEEHDKRKESLSEDIEDENMKEMINVLINLVEAKEEIKLKDAAEEMNVDESLVRRWGKLLEKKRIIEMKTPLLGDVVLKKAADIENLGETR